MPASSREGSADHGLESSSIISWLSIALAVLTAVFQGLVSALATMTESSAQWNFRFRLSLVEHWWWIFVSILLLASLAMSAVAFTAGKGGDPVSVLALSSATFVAVVQYTLPAWHHRQYVLTRWFAWTGDSRTAIDRGRASLCSEADKWARLATKYGRRLHGVQPIPSDYYGWRLWPAPGLKIDPADLLKQVAVEDDPPWDTEKAPPQVGVYTGSDANSKSVSLLWGQRQGFTRRVSRAISSMPRLLLTSQPTTMEGYDGRGLAHAMGILGRNKGLQPWELVFRATPETLSQMENSSTWSPRPAKVLRSFYKNAMQAQFQGLGEQFVHAATELALLLTDVPSWAAIEWLRRGMEHQSLETNLFLANNVLATVSDAERGATLAANYESSYVAMIVSLNVMTTSKSGVGDGGVQASRYRPDLTCTALLLKARGQDFSWVERRDVHDALLEEEACLSQIVNWKDAAARLLGLDGWPPGFLDLINTGRLA